MISEKTATVPPFPVLRSVIEKPAPVAPSLQPWLAGVLMNGHALGHPSVNTAFGVCDEAGLGCQPDDGLERHSGLEREVSVRIEQLLVPGIAEHEAVIRVVEREALG